MRPLLRSLLVQLAWLVALAAGLYALAAAGQRLQARERAPGTRHRWEVSWLPGRHLDRNRNQRVRRQRDLHD